MHATVSVCGHVGLYYLRESSCGGDSDVGAMQDILGGCIMWYNVSFLASAADWISGDSAAG